MIKLHERPDLRGLRPSRISRISALRLLHERPDLRGLRLLVGRHCRIFRPNRLHERPDLRGLRPIIDTVYIYKVFRYMKDPI